jgi:hypothetical protein
VQKLRESGIGMQAKQPFDRVRGIATELVYLGWRQLTALERKTVHCFS